MESSATSQLWNSGIVGLWYLRPSQLEIYDLVLNNKNPFVECARRFGKTTTALCYVIELVQKNPGWTALWCEPWMKQAREIVIPELEKIFKTAPDHLKPRYQTTDSLYIFPNGSRFKLRGVNEDKGESARGSFANIIVADEFGSWREADYVVNEVLRPQLLTTRGQFVFMSTPSRDLGHPYYRHKADAVRDNRFIRKIIHDNESLTQEEIEQAANEVGGVQTVAWRREYLCEEISDPERLVIAEYDETIHDLDDNYPLPEFYTGYVGIDLGFNDCTFICFGYYDFINRCLVIEDELSVRGKNSKEIADAALEIEARVYSGNKPKRFSDNDLQQLYDLASLFGYNATPTRKDDKLAAINYLRLRFSQNTIKIKKRCKNLRYQLKVGLWKESRSDFERSEAVGHLDGIMSLVYLNRNIDENHNPVPHMHGFDKTSMALNINSAHTKNSELAKAFNRFGSKNG